MESDDELRAGFGVSLNEADLLGFEVDPDRRVAAATFRVLTLPPAGQPPADRRVQLLFGHVGRVAASLRATNAGGQDPQVIPFPVTELLSVVQSFGATPVYGWKFVDAHDEKLAQWGDRLSLDWRSGSGGLSHSIYLFQEGEDRTLDFCVWFDHVEARHPNGVPMALSDFFAGGRRWWDGLHAGDPRTAGHDIFTGSPPTTGLPRRAGHR